MTTTTFQQIDYSAREIKLYLFSLLFVSGNILLPQLAHFVPQGGLIFLPIYFFTLIAAYKFGIKAGLLTAVFSPLVNHLLFGMPALEMLPIILIKSGLLAFAAATIAKKSKSVSLLLIALVILSYQVVGGMAEWAITGSFGAAIQDFTLGFPGMLIQLFLGWGLLKLLAKNEF